MPLALVVARFGRPVVQEATEHLAAEALVVGGAGDVQVPGLVDVVRRTDLRAGDLREHEEAAVFADDADGVSERPAVVVGQPALEGERIARCAKGVGLDARQQHGGGGGELVVRVAGDGNLPFLLLWSLVVVARSVKSTHRNGNHKKPHNGDARVDPAAR